MKALLGGRAARRWVHLVLGGALLMPYWLLALVILTSLHRGAAAGDARQAAVLQLLALVAALPAAAATALLPVVRVLEATAARALCAGADGDLAVTPSHSWAARRRTAVWYVLHLLLGGVVAGMSLAVPPAVAVLLFFPDPAWTRLYFGAHPPPAPVVAAGLVALLLTANAAAGSSLARLAPRLLGPTPAERLAAAEARVVELAHRNRLARELHDSVGHALSAVTIQAAAVGRVLRSDPEFAAEALRAIEETARAAVAELDTVLGVLREEESGPAGPTLAELDSLVRQMRLSGVRVDLRTGPGLGRLPAPLSREAYRIVQEGLTNVLRHAGPVPARLRIDLGEGRLTVELTNPIGADRPSRPGGGRGLRGMAERAAALHGDCRSGPTEDGADWRLTAALPTDRSAVSPR
ncbi:sensor histidine kinase [Kitasatospora sp. NPDC088346]|uniref:sensor histidine kinase n=1 Tax=Kitasatospora sp. NPDC088346 TaxID=3364073 RepID=UPI0037FF0A83